MVKTEDRQKVVREKRLRRGRMESTGVRQRGFRRWRMDSKVVRQGEQEDGGRRRKASGKGGARTWRM